jgi:inorganic phosphate transporter, PiT family
VVTAGLVFVIAIALAFDFFNGFHDAANSIATVVSTRVLTPKVAVLWAAFFNFVAFLIFGTKVAATIANDVVEPGALTLAVVFSGLVGAIAWDLLTWWLGLPTSSSHALIGGMAGAAVAHAGWSSLVASGFRKIAVFIVLSPILGLLLGFTILMIVMWTFHRYRRVDRLNRGFRRGQLVSAAAFSLGHGANDAQKTMGVIVGLLVSSNALFVRQEGWLRYLYLPNADHIPLWVEMAAYTAIGLGTALGGWRIVKTMGSRITKLRPFGGFCAETSGGISILIASQLGVPVSTTHTITGAIVGVGAAQRLSAVRWGVATRIVWAWILTIPMAAAIAAVSYLVLTR